MYSHSSVVSNEGKVIPTSLICICIFWTVFEVEVEPPSTGTCLGIGCRVPTESTGVVVITEVICILKGTSHHWGIYCKENIIIIPLHYSSNNGHEKPHNCSLLHWSSQGCKISFSVMSQHCMMVWCDTTPWWVLGVLILTRRAWHGMMCHHIFIVASIISNHGLTKLCLFVMPFHWFMTISSDVLYFYQRWMVTLKMDIIWMLHHNIQYTRDS